MRCIRHIEHYCNEYDMVSRWGALDNAQVAPPDRYSGTVFVRRGATGHMFNQHYLAIMFPLRASLSKAACNLEGTVESLIVAFMTSGGSMNNEGELAQLSRLSRYVDGESPACHSNVQS